MKTHAVYTVFNSSTPTPAHFTWRKTRKPHILILTLTPIHKECLCHHDAVYSVLIYIKLFEWLFCIRVGEANTCDYVVFAVCCPSVIERESEVIRMLESTYWLGFCERTEKCFIEFKAITAVIRSRDSSVGIATSYWLDDRGFGVQVPVGVRIFTSPRRPDRLWGPPNLLSNWYRGKAVGAWSWLLISD
jgi:hypothetical protein